MYSIDSSTDREHIAPFTTKYAQRISKIHEQREKTAQRKENDVLYARSAIGPTFRVSSADQSRSYNAERTFGPVRPLSAGRTRSDSSERTRVRSSSAERLTVNTSTDASTTSFQRAMSSFDKELQIQKDIAAQEKQKLALLQVKKESYINYLKNKGNTPWIPGGEGAKHESSLHKSVHKSAAEQRMLQRAWCRSPWPGQLPKSVTADSSDGYVSNIAADYNNNANSYEAGYNSNSAEQRYGAQPLQRSPARMQVLAAGSAQSPVLPRYSVSPQRLPQRTQSNDNANAPPLPVSTPQYNNNRTSGDAQSVTHSVNQSVNSAYSVNSRATSNTANARKPTSTDSNSKYVALTVRLIQTTQQHKSAYGVFIVPRNCTRLEMIANLERQFNVHNQVSDISITYRTGYSHGVTIKSLSMGTIADIPQVDDYSSITVFLGGSTIFDSLGNIVTHTEKGDTTTAYVSHADDSGVGSGNSTGKETMTTVLTRGGIHSRGAGNGSAGGAAAVSVERDNSGDFSQQQDGSPLRGLSVGDNLLYFDDNTSENNSVNTNDDASSTYSRASRVSRLSQLGTSAPVVHTAYGARAVPTTIAATASAGAGNAKSSNTATSGNRPVQVPMYEKLHPEQPMHGFSYISPAQPLLHDSLAAKVLGAANSNISAIGGAAGDGPHNTSFVRSVPAPGAYSVPVPVPVPVPVSNASFSTASGATALLSRGYSTRSLLAQQQSMAKTQAGESGGAGAVGTRMLAEELLDLDDHHELHLHDEDSEVEATATATAAKTSGARYHDEALRRSIMEKKSSFRDIVSKPAGGNGNGTGGSSGRTALLPSSTAAYLYDEPNLVVPVRHAPRDWLAEAEAQVRSEQTQGQNQDRHRLQQRMQGQSQQDQLQVQVHQNVEASEEPIPIAAVQENVGGLDVGSPAYRGATTSSALRRRDRSGSESSNLANAWNSRSRSRERTNSGVFSVGSASAGSFRNAKQRSRSADPLNCTQSQHSVLSQPRLFLPANPNPNPPPRIIRTTASSRGRDAFINSRVPHFDEVNQNIYGNREGVAGGGQSNASAPLALGRSNSTGRLRRSNSMTSQGSSAAVVNRHDSFRSPSQAGKRHLRGQLEQAEDNGVFMQQHNLLGNKIFSRSSEELDFLGQELTLSSPMLPPHGYTGAPVRQAYYPSNDYGVNTGSARSTPDSNNSLGYTQDNNEVRGMHRQSRASAAVSNEAVDKGICGTGVGDGTNTNSSSFCGGSSSQQTSKGRGRAGSRQLSMNLDDLLADMQ